MTGRRRIGKTYLVWKAYEDEGATFFEVKHKADNIDMKVLENKAAAFLRATGEFKGYKISYKGLSMDDM